MKTFTEVCDELSKKYPDGFGVCGLYELLETCGRRPYNTTPYVLSPAGLWVYEPKYQQVWLGDPMDRPAPANVGQTNVGIMQRHRANRQGNLFTTYRYW